MKATRLIGCAAAAAALVLVAGSGAVAQQRPGRPEAAPAAASTLPVPAGGSLGGIDVISAELIAATAAPDIKAALALAPTLVVNETDGPGGVATLSVRGSTPEEVLVLLDGHRLADAQSSSFNVNDLTVPVERVERIEVLSGPASVLYGADALGGVVNIVTRPAGTTPALALSLGLGEDAEKRLAGGAQYGVGKVGLRLDGQLRSGDGFRENSDFELTNVVASLALAPAPWGADVRWTTLEREAGVPGPAGLPSPNAREQESRDEVRAGFTYRPGVRWDFRTGVFLLRRSRDFDDPAPPSAAPETPAAPIASSDETQSQGVDALLDFNTGRGELYTIGGEWVTDEIDSSADGDHETDHWSVFGQDQWRLGRWSAVGAVRRDEHSLFGGTTTYSLSGGWEAGGWKFSASWAQGYRAPDFDELYRNEEFLQGNADLKPETSESYEGTAELGGAAGRVRLRAFRRNVSDLIRWVDVDGDMVLRPENLARARVEGWEAEVLYRLSPTVALPVSYQSLTAEDEDTGERLAGSVRTLWKAAIESTGRSFLWSVDYAATDRGRYQLSDESWSYGVLNAALSWRHTLGSGAVQLSMRGENLQDRDYQTVEGYPQRGRTWFAEVRVEL